MLSKGIDRIEGVVSRLNTFDTLGSPNSLDFDNYNHMHLDSKIANPCTRILATTSPCTLNLMITKLYTLNLCNYKFMHLNFDNSKPLHLDSFKCRTNFLALSMANTCPFLLKNSYRNPIERTTKKTLKPLYKIYIIGFFFCLKEYLCNSTSSTEVSSFYLQKEDLHNFSIKRK